MAYKPQVLAVADGGTGTATLTNHGVLVGAATNAVTQLAAGSAGQVIQSGGAAADPVYSTATYPSTATGTGTLLRADGTNWTTTTSTYPATNAINTLLYASSANVMAALPTANSAVLATNGSGVPSITATPTVTSITFGAGSALSTYTTATWTPNIQINSSSAGITYTTQLGGWTQIGNVVHFYVNVLLSSKGASVVGVSISNFPFTFTGTGQNQSVTVCDFDGVTLATYTTLAITPINGTTVGSFVLSTASSGTAVTTLANTMITNTSRFRFTGIFLLN